MLDLRNPCLKALTLRGCTLDDEVFENPNEFRTIVAALYPLADIVRAEDAFLAKATWGSLSPFRPPLKPVASSYRAQRQVQ